MSLVRNTGTWSSERKNVSISEGKNKISAIRNQKTLSVRKYCIDPSYRNNTFNSTKQHISMVGNNIRLYNNTSLRRNI